MRGWPVDGVACDTALAAYLARPGQATFDLSDLVQRYLHRTLDPDHQVNSEQQLSLIPDEDENNARDIDTRDMVKARAIIDLAGALEEHLDKLGQKSLLADMELPVMTVLGIMERDGIAVDTDYLDDLQSTFAAEAEIAAKAAYAEIGREVNLGSPKQLQVVLFDELNMPKTKRTKTGYTTDADALVSLHEQTGHAFLTHLLRHRDVTRLKTTVEGLRKAVSDDGRIHTTYQQTVAATGRLSSTEPNLQNIPIRTDEGRLIRRAFIPGPKADVLLTADYSQIEMRIMATLSEDAGLIEAFNSGEDLHTFVAMRAFGVPAEQVTPELRRRIKAMSYGLAYGLSAFGLSGQLKISVDDAKEQMEAYFSRFGGVRDYLRRHRRAGPEGRLHRDGVRPPAVRPGPDQRQPAEAGDGRAGRAERPDPGQRGGHHQGGHAGRATPDRGRGAAVADAAAGARRTGLRGGRRRAGRDDGRAARGDGRRLPAGGAAGGVGRFRGQLGRRGALMLSSRPNG